MEAKIEEVREQIQELEKLFVLLQLGHVESYSVENYNKITELMNELKLLIWIIVKENGNNTKRVYEE